MGFWALDEASGLSILDGSGYGNNGNISGGVQWVQGVSGSALRFDGSTGAVSINGAASLDLSAALTVSAWVRPERVATQTVLKKATNSAVDGYEIAIALDGRPFFRVNQTTSGNTFRVDAPSAASTDGSTWVHLVGTFDGDRLRLYVDGQEVGSIAGPAAVALNDLPLMIGHQPGGGHPLQGTVDDVRVYDRALSTAEVNALYGRAAG